MKKTLLLSAFTLILIHLSWAQEYPTFTATGTNQGTGTFTNATLSNFTWIATGTLNKDVQILNNEVFDDGNQFEINFGQADNADNLRLQASPNGTSTVGQFVSSRVRLTIDFNQLSPAQQWGFCIIDIDVENCLISAIDENDNIVSAQAINKWLVELFDANLVTDGLNTPKWDSLNAALLGFDTPSGYTTYDSVVIGGMPDSEAAGAFFMPDIPLKSLIIDYENLQEGSATSYHFYIASAISTSIQENKETIISVYPNPANTIINIQLPNSQLKANATKDIILYNVLGEIVLQTKLNQDNLTLDVSQLDKGIYYMKMIVAGKSIVKKLMIE